MKTEERSTMPERLGGSGAGLAVFMFSWKVLAWPWLGSLLLGVIAGLVVLTAIYIYNFPLTERRPKKIPKTTPASQSAK